MYTIAALLYVMLAAVPSYATLIPTTLPSGVAVLYETRSSLSWLPLRETVLAESAMIDLALQAGSRLEDFRYATAAETWTLLTQEYDLDSREDVRRFFEDFYIVSPSKVSVIHGYFHPNIISGEIAVASFSLYPESEPTIPPYFDVQLVNYPVLRNNGDFGSFLVTTLHTPEPSSLAYLLCGSVFLVFRLLFVLKPGKKMTIIKE